MSKHIWSTVLLLLHFVNDAAEVQTCLHAIAETKGDIIACVIYPLRIYIIDTNNNYLVHIYLMLHLQLYTGMVWWWQVVTNFSHLPTSWSIS